MRERRAENVRAGFISRMYKVAGKLVILLHVNWVLSVDEMAALAGVPDGKNSAEQLHA